MQLCLRPDLLRRCALPEEGKGEMRILDTREQKSPRFLVEAFPDLILEPLPVTDYFTGTKWWQRAISHWKGHAVEIKLGKDFGLHTEPLERFQDELYRMACWRQQNPQVVCHAAWVVNAADHNHDWFYILTEWRVFVNLCCKYGIWPHVVYENRFLVEFLKQLDQPSQYVPFEPFLKKSHEEGTLLGRMLRQIPDISSPVAIDLATCKTYEDTLNVKGMRKKDGSPTKRFGKFNATLVLLQDYIHEVFS